MAAVTRQTQEEHPRNGQSRKTSVPRTNEEYSTEVSEEIEGRVTKKLFQEFSGTESRILGALSKLDEFLLNPQIQTHSETVPGTIQNTNVENQGAKEDDSQSDPHPEAGLFRSQTTQNSGPEVGHDRDSAQHPNKTYYHYFRTKYHSIHLYIHKNIYIKFYIVVRTYVPIRKHNILQDYDNYMLYFVSDVNPY